MARKRKTASERRQEEADAEGRAWREFNARVREIESFAEVKAFAEGPAPRSGAPGRQFYSNLAFFLGAFKVPSGSNRAERTLYLHLIQRFDETGQLTPDSG